MNWKRIERWMIPSLVLTGVVLRFVLLPFSCIWLDEAFSIKLARESMQQIVQTLSSDNGSPLFYFLLHGWMRLFGDGEYALTMLTVLLDCAALVAIPFFLRELFSDLRIRIAGTACAAFCLPCLHQATNLRYYSLMVLCVVLSWLFFYRAVRRVARQDGMLFLCFSMIGFYAHTLYLFVPLSQLAVLLFFYRNRLRAALVTAGFFLVGISPWFPALVLQASGYAEGSTPETVPPLLHYHGAIGAYMLSISGQMLAVDGMKWLRMFVAGVLVSFLVFHLVRGKSAEDRTARELFVAHLFSIGLIVIISMFRPVFWLDKMDLIGLPLIGALTGYAVSKVRWSGLILTGLIVVNLAGALRYTAWRTMGHLTEQRDVIKRLASEISPDDAMIETGISHFTVNYYLDQMKVQTGPRYVFPEVQLTRPSCIDPKKLLEDQRELTLEAAVLVEKLKPGSGNMYVFYSPYEGLAPLYDQLESSFLLERSIPVRQHPWGPIYTRVDVYTRK